MTCSFLNLGVYMLDVYYTVHWYDMDYFNILYIFTNTNIFVLHAIHTRYMYIHTYNPYSIHRIIIPITQLKQFCYHAI
jgi:hypothetical protein